MSRAVRSACAVVGLVCAVACGGVEEPVHVLLITLDTTRADHLSVYGYARETSPNLEAFARESVRYKRAWSTSSWTLPAHASMFTGLYPSAHGCHFDMETQQARRGSRVRVLGQEFVTLAERLREEGYQTAAFVGGPWLKPDFGVVQGFDHVDTAGVDTPNGRRAEDITEQALRWLQATAEERPTFLFVNYFDPHNPYDPPAGFHDYPLSRQRVPRRWWERVFRGARLNERLRSILIDRYDSEIRAMDHQLGRLLAAFDSWAAGRATLVIVTSDHGESFGEDGMVLHNGSLSEETLRVPLIIRYPQNRDAGTTSDEIVQLVDIPLIVAAEIGLAAFEETNGALPGQRRTAYGELFANSHSVKRFGERFNHEFETVIEWPLKLVVQDRKSARVYRLHDDVGETEMPVVPADARASLENALEAYRKAVIPAAAQSIEVSDETLESLRALGYLDDSTDEAREPSPE
jgi:hypothetical protein